MTLQITIDVIFCNLEYIKTETFHYLVKLNYLHKQDIGQQILQSWEDSQSLHVMHCQILLLYPYPVVQFDIKK